VYFCKFPLTSYGIYWNATNNIRLRSSPTSSQDYTADVEASIHYLANLENVWAGARRSRLIIEELLKQTRMERRAWNFDDFGPDEIADYMFGQENANFQFSSFDMG
jgi:hypothetical protein